MKKTFDKKTEKREFEEEVVHIDRISRTVAGGRRIRFRAAVVIGDKKGRVGIGVAKASEVILAVQKAITLARKNLIKVSIVNETIPHEIKEQFGAAKVILKPASMGTGVIAGGAVRVIVTLAGIKNVLSKILGSKNQINNLKATINALKKLTIPERVEKKKILVKFNSKKPKEKIKVSKTQSKGKNETTSIKNK